MGGDGQRAPLAICTIVSKNYLAQARALVRSFLDHHPEGRAFVLLADRVDGYFDPASEPFELLEAEDLEIPGFDVFAFRYSILEFNTAVKPFLLEHLFRRYGLERLCYFDPDIIIYRRLEELEDALDESTIVLTPHLLGFLDDGRQPDELSILRAGSYNLGFIGLSRREPVQDFLRWWQCKLIRHCTADPEQGLFVDQRWVDLVPGMFANVRILRDPGYNVAYWNLNHREVRQENGTWMAGSRPLSFFHFSGFSPADVERVSKHQDRYSLVDLPEAAPLFWEYRDRLRQEGHDAVASWPYAFGCFDDGTPIPECARRLAREVDPDGTRWPTPFTGTDEDSFVAWLNQPVDDGEITITQLALRVYHERSDLRTAFPDILGSHRRGFAEWFLMDGMQQHMLAERFAGPVSRSLACVTSAPAENMASHRKVVLHPQSVGGNAAVPAEQQAFTAGLNVIGYLRSENGIGEIARGTLRAALAAGLPVAQTVIKTNDLARKTDRSCQEVPTGTPYGVNLLHVNADQVPVVAQELGSSLLRSRISIGYWFWELNRFPTMWQPSFDHLDEVWVASAYTQETLAPVSPIPVVRMRPCVEVRPVHRPDRGRFGLPDDRFIILFAFDPFSISERKNPFGVVEAYRRAFGSRPDRTLLVIKTCQLARVTGYEDALGIDAAYPAQLADAVAGVSGVLIDGYLDRTDLDHLFAASDAIISLHRCEGFGLTLAEGMLRSKPCIATGYSSNLDFMTDENSYLVDHRLVELERDFGPYRQGSVWADPDLDHAATLLRRVVEEPDEARVRAAQGADDIRRLYGAAPVGQRIAERVALLSDLLGEGEPLRRLA